MGRAERAGVQDPFSIVAQTASAALAAAAAPGRGLITGCPVR
jgi:hypothetical protein